MGNDENEIKNKTSDESETASTETQDQVENSDISITVDELLKKLERHEKDTRGQLPEVKNPAGARDFTDEELETLKECFKEGLRKMKDHPWNGKKDE